MDILYTLGSFISFLGVIFLFIGFKNNFARLNSTQKTGIILTVIGVAIPFFIGFINGFLANA
ncbi:MULTISPECIES: hypothetical protein [Paraclostridium]|uniref:hypothetical protein n=1 Tax=Paraclostridium TaxID=1849822 RepID=UPI000B9F0EA6|nr:MULTISPECIES: hypothetical protein [Paraclostridium]MCU9816578.1 hypothetical protein [Paraclostridium sp. AKS73]OXX82643.1 hypothetical protein AVM15_17205 [Paraclostridium benzoelyticum]